MIALSSIAILADLLLNLAGFFLTVSCKISIWQLADFLAGFYQPFSR